MAVTPEELDAQGVSSDLIFAARALGIGQSSAYTAAHKGDFPCRVIKIGGRYIVPTAELRAILGQTPSAPNPAPSDRASRSRTGGHKDLATLHREALTDLLGSNPEQRRQQQRGPKLR